MHKSGLYSRLPTEKPNPKTRHIDLLSPLAIVQRINEQDELVARAVGSQARAIAQAAEAVAKSLRQGGTIILVGAGTSGRLAVLEAAECPPTFGTLPKQIRAVIAGGKPAVFRSQEGAEDNGRAGAAAMAGLGKRDVVIGIAASGVTPFVRFALKSARAKGCRTVLVTSNGNPPNNPAHIVIAPRVGPEVIAGSTRLKSGTAAKLVLNTLTTAAMIRLGKVYDRWMVDLRPMSHKLRLRAVRIVCDLGRVSPDKAEALLKASGYSVKLSVLMARAKLTAPEARRRLKENEGSLRRALES